jgi:hypothetical protein
MCKKDGHLLIVFKELKGNFDVLLYLFTLKGLRIELVVVGEFLLYWESVVEPMRFRVMLGDSQY